MRNPDPIDPVPLIAAMKELARHWETHAHSFSDAADESEKQPRRMVWDMSEAQLRRHYGTFEEAASGVFFIAVISRKIRVWVENGPHWKRPTLFTIRSLLPPGSGLYAGQEELNQVLGSRWPTAYPAVFHPTSVPNDGGHRASSFAAIKRNTSAPAVKGKGGRPKGLGYSLKDVSTFELILAAQRQTGNVENQHFLVKKFAGQVRGVSFDSHVDRLRKGLPNWLDQNGLKWAPPIKAKFARGE